MRENIQKTGYFYMKWDNNRSLPIVPNENSFSVIPRLEQLELTEKETKNAV
jgi:hypothetical protein